jgi:hypothetical protein
MLRKVASSGTNVIVQEFSGKLKHAGVRKIPAEFQHLPVVTNVRNVFEHYVSRYTFRWWAEPKHARKVFYLEKVLEKFPTFPDLSFSEFLDLFNEWSFRRNMPPKKVETLTRYNIGYNSWCLVRLTTNKPLSLIRKVDDMDIETINAQFKRIRFLRTENLNGDLYNLMKEFVAEKEQIGSILNAPPILPKRGGRAFQKATWDSYFGERDTALVKQKDHLYFRLFPDMLPELAGE